MLHPITTPISGAAVRADCSAPVDGVCTGVLCLTWHLACRFGEARPRFAWPWHPCAWESVQARGDSNAGCPRDERDLSDLRGFRNRGGLHGCTVHAPRVGKRAGFVRAAGRQLVESFGRPCGVVEAGFGAHATRTGSRGKSTWVHSVRVRGMGRSCRFSRLCTGAVRLTVARVITGSRCARRVCRSALPTRSL